MLHLARSLQRQTTHIQVLTTFCRAAQKRVVTLVLDIENRKVVMPNENIEKKTAQIRSGWNEHELLSRKKTAIDKQLELLVLVISNETVTTRAQSLGGTTAAA